MSDALKRHPIANVCGSRDRYAERLAVELRNACRVDSVDDLLCQLDSLLPGVTAVDLISHTRTDDRLLALGEDVIDTRRPAVVLAFSDLSTLLQKHGVRQLRLLGCGTATRQAGRRTIRDLARILYPIEVFGTLDAISNHAFDVHGLRTCAARYLVSSADLKRP